MCTHLKRKIKSTSFTDENCFQIVKTLYLPGGFTLAPHSSTRARLGPKAVLRTPRLNFYNLQ